MFLLRAVGWQAGVVARSGGCMQRYAAAACASSSTGLWQPSGQHYSTSQAPEQMHYDVCIVGAGPAGLAAAIRLKQQCKLKDKEVSVCVIEKGSEVGAHVLSGNVLELTSLYELLPGLKDYIKNRDSKPRFSFFSSSSDSSSSSSTAAATTDTSSSSSSGSSVAAATIDSSGSSSSSSTAAPTTDGSGSPPTDTQPPKEPLSPLQEAAAARGLLVNDQGFPELPPMDFSDLPIRQQVAKDLFYYLTPTGSLRLPVPPVTRNKNNYIISLSELTRWLGAKAEAMGVDIFPGFAGKEVLYDWHGGVAGVATGDFGIAKDGSKKPTFTPGVELVARVTLFAEGCRGSLSESVIKHFNLRADSCPQSYALGIKEVWEVPEEQHTPGLVIHTLGYPLGGTAYGGGFVYHMEGRRVALGLVVGLDYSNPWLNPYQEFQRFKLHPLIHQTLKGGTCLQYGARSLNEGGLQSIPRLSFPGGALIGCSAGFLNVPKIKGTHTAIKSGIAAADAAFFTLTDEQQKPGPVVLQEYQENIENSWAWYELEKVRNYRPGFRWGLLPGILHSGVLAYLTRGREPYTLKHRHADHESLKLAKDCQPINYPKPDGEVTYDLPTSLYRSGTNHEHDQPAHLVLKNAGVPEVVNHAHYAGPESRYCPAGVYEYAIDEVTGRPKLVINAQNCLHCKACSIKDPRQNIDWTVPEGGGGPNYSIM